MTERPTLTRLAVAWGHEDGEHWWAEGHLTDEAMVLSVVAWETYCASYEAGDYAELLFGDDAPQRTGKTEWDCMASLETALGNVSRIWLKPDPDNEENMLPCDEDHPEAAAWTQFTR